MTSKVQYDDAFHEEQRKFYPSMDAFERMMGYAIDRRTLERAARVLACPVKANPPNWQHGRLIYATLRARIANLNSEVLCVDIGTAKGFSAVMMAHAFSLSKLNSVIVSVDAVDPKARVARNTVAEVDGLKTVEETIATVMTVPTNITFLHMTGITFLTANVTANCKRIHFAFVDGKHSYDQVSREAALLKQCQKPGDVAVFDDTHIEGVGRAVDEIEGYQVERLTLKPERAYAIATRI